MATARGTKPLGPTSRRAARNLKELRGRIPVRELSQRLEELGQPILPSGITKIEQGRRRVDVDDLVALAIALNVSPNRLLLDPESDDEELLLTDGVTCSRKQAWNWATGSESLPDRFDEEGRKRSRSGHDGLSRFRGENRPNEPEAGGGMPLKALLEIGQTKLAPVVDAVQAALADGVTFEQITEYLSLFQTLQTTVGPMIAAAATDHADSRPNKPKSKSKRKKSTQKGAK
jgi:transcriptional regulator with XRE-family HTH domain